jgi:hypothetical protein
MSQLIEKESGPQRTVLVAVQVQGVEEADEDGEHRVDHAGNPHGRAIPPSSIHLRSSPTVDRLLG